MADDYHRGEMDIHEQVSTYHAVMGMTKWGSLALAVAILALVLWFCTPAGFIGGVVPGIVLLAAGIFFLREKPASAH